MVHLFFIYIYFVFSIDLSPSHSFPWHRILTPYEAKSLVALLYSEDKGLVERALATIANCAAFSVNLVRTDTHTHTQSNTHTV